MKYLCLRESFTLDELEIIKQKINESKTYLSDNHPDKIWMDGFNSGLDWAIRIINKDKSAY